MQNFKSQNPSPFEGKKDQEVINATESSISLYLNGFFVDLPAKSSFKVYKLSEQEERAIKELFIAKKVWYSGLAVDFPKPEDVTEYELPVVENNEDKGSKGEAVTAVTLSYGEEHKVGKKSQATLTLTPEEGVVVKTKEFSIETGDEFIDLNEKTGEVTYKSAGSVTVKVKVTDNTDDANEVEATATFEVVAE